MWRVPRGSLTVCSHREKPSDRDLNRVLASPSRVRILQELQGAAAPLTALELATRVGLHVSTVRDHLRQMKDVGIVTSRRLHGGRTGRPRELFSAAGVEPATADAGTAAGTRLLARVLAAYVAGFVDAVEPTSAEIGQAWGRHLVSAEPFTHHTVADAQAALQGIFTSLGLALRIERHDSVILMIFPRCPFGDIAMSHHDVACGFHRGLISGVLAELGAPLALAEFRDCGHEGGCVATLRVDDDRGRSPSPPGVVVV
jgi:predicted ArsR family transcriptional regulator